jgi:cytochrome b pre-mRNA-processing protein 3
MFFKFFKSKQERQIEALAYAHYIACLEQSRLADFYTSLNVEDSFEGRFELLVLHVSMVLHSLEKLENREKAAAVGQELFDTMFKDMDQSLREGGIGDMGVPRRMQAMMEGYNGRHTRYRLIFGRLDDDKRTQDERQKGREELEAALAKNVYGFEGADLKESEKQQLQTLVDYTVDGLCALDTMGESLLEQNTEIQFSEIAFRSKQDQDAA